MEKHSLALNESHTIAIMNGKRILISTGVPISIGDTKDINILGQIFGLENQLLGKDIKQIASALKTDINAIIGMDILSKFIFYVSHSIEAIIFSDFFINFKENMQELPIDMSFNLPIVTVKMGGIDMKMVLDTGSKLSYLDASLLGGMKNDGTLEVFYPGCGTMVTEIFHLPLELRGKTMDIHFGMLPDILLQKLSRTGCTGILGSEIFKYYNIQFCLKKSTLWLVEKGQAR
ncbi:MAG: hypothetical protein PHD29_00545 [bacterium]|nr:hypothetical protein [bacterium]MDD5756195.1 hypothetical protein [bacterium]